MCHSEVGNRVLRPHGRRYTAGQGSVPLHASVVTGATAPLEESEASNECFVSAGIRPLHPGATRLTPVTHLLEQAWDSLQLGPAAAASLASLGCLTSQR
jgi:hypothetical protein